MKRKLSYLLVIFISMFIFDDCIKAQDIASCKYDYNGETYEFTISIDSSLLGFEKQKLNKSQTTDVVYNFKDKDFIKKVYSGDSVSSCPLLSFATFRSSNDLYHVIDFTSSNSEPCGGIEETGYTCTAKTGVSGNLNVLSSSVDVEDSKEQVYCRNTYNDKDLGLVTAETFTDGDTNYFRLYDENNNLIGTAQPASQFQVNEKWYSAPNKSSLYSTNCNSADLVLTANYDKVEVETGDVNIEEEKEDKIVTNGETIKIVRRIYHIIKILIPVLIVLLSVVDFLKVVIVDDEKNYKSSWDKFIKRLMIGVIFFIVPILVSFILNYSGIETEQTFLDIFK